MREIRDHVRKRILNLSRSGLRPPQVAVILNEQGWGRADLGGRWYWQTIAKVVRDSRSKKPRR